MAPTDPRTTEISDNIQNNLSSNDHLVVANELGRLAIEEVRANAELGGEKIAAALDTLFKEIWKDLPTDGDKIDLKKAMEDKAGREAIFKTVLQSLDTPEGKKLLAHAYARMGHLYEIAGIITRENYFRELRLPADRRKTSQLAGVPEFVDKLKDETASQIVDRLNKPVFEIIMTQHPTNTNSLFAIKAQRRIGMVAEDIVLDDAPGTQNINDLTQRLREELRLFFDDKKTPLLHREIDRDGNLIPGGADVNFTVRDETNIVLNQLENVYDDFSRVYKQCDDALQAKGGYDPLKLKLNLRFGSWVNGDKDGNTSVTCETTLEALGLHKLAILKKYDASLSELERNGLHSEKLKQWHDAIKTSADTLQRELNDMRDEMADHPPHLTRRQFNAHLQAISGIIPAPEGGGKKSKKPRNLEEAKRVFLTDLEAEYNNENDGPLKDETLMLIRRVRQFGFTFAKIEYRETAKEYTTVVSRLLKDYEQLGDDGRMNLLEGILKAPNKPQQVLNQQTWNEILGEDEPSRPYIDGTKADSQAMTYHTLQRMRLAAHFPEMIQDNVLAECTKSQNILEAKLLQHVIYPLEDDKKIACMGIIPLFEDPDTMKDVDQIVKRAYKSEAYQKHMKNVAEVRFALTGEETPPTQQVQIAHSDNARRSGLLAARGFIHRAHKVLRTMTEQWNAKHPEKAVQLQFFEGGSISDAYRNGVRSLSASIDDFKLHDFAKFTFQGGDIINYFNQPSSSLRLLTRAVSHSANKQYDLEKSITNEDTKPINLYDDVAIRALTRTLEDYENYDFTSGGEKSNKMGVLLAALDYEGEVTAGNRGSRAAVRGFGKAASIAMGAVLKPIAVDKVRTISFSEAWQHNGVVPSWIGSDKMEQYLTEAIRNEVVHDTQIFADKKYEDADRAQHKSMSDPQYAQLQEERKQFLKDFGDISDSADGTESGKVLPRHIKELFNHSPAFRDAQERAAYGVALSDMGALSHLNLTFTKQPGDSASVKGWKDMGREYLTRIRQTYKNAGVMAEAALAKAIEPRNWSFTERLAAYDANSQSAHDTSPLSLRMSVTGAFDRFTDQILIKDAYRDFILAFKQGLQADRPQIKDPANLSPDEKAQYDHYWHMRGVMHNAGDTVVHGRVLPADDTYYGKQRQNDRNFSPAAETLQALSAQSR